MDPNKVLEQLREAIAAWEDNDLNAAFRLVAAAQALDGWLSRGGATPTAWTPPVSLELVVVRDPDGPNEIAVFSRGTPVAPEDYVEYNIDAGAGWAFDDWAENRDHCLTAASSADVRTHLLEQFNDPPGGDYVEDVPADADGDLDWMATRETGAGAG